MELRNLKIEFKNRKQLNRFDIIAFDKIGVELFNTPGIFANDVVWFENIGFFKLNENDLFIVESLDLSDNKYYRFDFINDYFDLLDNELNVIKTKVELTLNNE